MDMSAARTRFRDSLVQEGEFDLCLTSENEDSVDRELHRHCRSGKQHELAWFQTHGGVIRAFVWEHSPASGRFIRDSHYASLEMPSATLRSIRERLCVADTRDVWIALLWERRDSLPDIDPAYRTFSRFLRPFETSIRLADAIDQPTAGFLGLEVDESRGLIKRNGKKELCLEVGTSEWHTFLVAFRAKDRGATDAEWSKGYPGDSSKPSMRKCKARLNGKLYENLGIEFEHGSLKLHEV